MSEPFGAELLRVVQPREPRSGAADMALVRDRLHGLGEGGLCELNLARPLPTAAFSRRDRLLPGFDAAEAAVAAHGFAPITRPVGGHLAVYGDGCLVLHHWARHQQPRDHIRQRFELMGDAIASALRGLGADARVGPVPGEYCDGEFSVNHAGRSKVAGTGQRIVRAGFLFSAVIVVHTAEPLREALTQAYQALRLPFDPATAGSVADAVPGVTVSEVREALVATLAELLDLEPSLAPCG